MDIRYTVRWLHENTVYTLGVDCLTTATLAFDSLSKDFKTVQLWQGRELLRELDVLVEEYTPVTIPVHFREEDEPKMIEFINSYWKYIQMVRYVSNESRDNGEYAGWYIRVLRPCK